MGPILNSWKEIAAYLSRGVRTVQRWEQNERLPVHHVGLGKRAPVFAYPAEIDAWLLEQRVTGMPIARDTALRSESRRLRGETRVLVSTLRGRMAEMRRTLEVGRTLYESHQHARKLTTS